MDFDEAVRLIRLKDARYQPQAYDVVRLGLDHAQKIVHGEPKKGKSIVNRHVSGPQLLEGFRQHCLLYTSPSPRDRQKSRMPSSA